MEKTFIELKLFQVRPDKFERFEVLIREISANQLKCEGCLSLKYFKRFFTIDGIELDDSLDCSYRNIKTLIKYYHVEATIMTILPSTSLRNQYSEISERCKATGEPIFLTKNGEGDLVVMSIEAYEKKEALLALKERLLDIELEQRNGAKYYSLDELDSALKRIVG